MPYKKLQILQSLFPAIKFNNTTAPCDICHLAKQKTLSFPNSDTTSNSVFDIIHMDIWGPLSTSSVHGHRFFLTIVDDKSRHTWLYLL